jgi:hypothetical protein
MELIKENIEKQRRVYKGVGFYRKEWSFENQHYYDEHIDIMEELRPGYILNHGCGNGKMFVDLKIIPGVPANTFEHTPEFIRKIYNFCLKNIEETQPYAHGDWVLSNIIIDGDKIEMVDWDNVSVYQPTVVLDKLHSDLRSAFGDKFDAVLSEN